MLVVVIVEKVFTRVAESQRDALAFAKQCFRNAIIGYVFFVLPKGNQARFCI